MLDISSLRQCFSINNFIRITENLNKKSFNIKELIEYDALKIQSPKKQTRYICNIQKMIQDLNAEVDNGN